MKFVHPEHAWDMKVPGYTLENKVAVTNVDSSNVEGLHPSSCLCLSPHLVVQKCVLTLLDGWCSWMLIQPGGQKLGRSAKLLQKSRLPGQRHATGGKF